MVSKSLSTSRKYSALYAEAGEPVTSAQKVHAELLASDPGHKEPEDEPERDPEIFDHLNAQHREHRTPPFKVSSIFLAQKKGLVNMVVFLFY